IYLTDFINEKNRIIFEDNELKKWYDKTDVSKTQKIVEVNS
ncbi:dCMP deaminase, partial [Lactobacillus paragasseri]